MYRPVLQFIKKKKAVLTWSMIGRLIVLAVYGEEHEADDSYPIDKALTFDHIAKRKLLNPLKPFELIASAVSISLDYLIGVEDENLSWRWGVYAIKSIIVDIPFAMFQRLSSPVNSIVRPLKNLYLESPWKFLLTISMYALGVAACFLSGGFSLALGGGPLVVLGINSMLGVTAASTVSALAVASDVVIMTGLTGKAAALVGKNDDDSDQGSRFIPYYPKNNISRLLFNSNKNADTFTLAKMNKRYAALSFIGGDPICPPDPLINRVRNSVADSANLAGTVAATVADSACMVQSAALATAAGASSLAAIVPSPFNTPLDSIAAAAGIAGATAVAVGSASRTAQKVAANVEASARPRMHC